MKIKWISCNKPLFLYVYTKKWLDVIFLFEMRKTFNLLFVCLIALYGRIGYQIIHNTDLPQCQPEGSLSDVAEEVIAIPLETNNIVP